MSDIFIYIGMIIGLFLALYLPYILIREHYKSLEEKMIKNTQKLLEKLDEFENRGKKNE